MIVECYVLDAYCDHPRHPHGKHGCFSAPGQFTGPNRRAAHKEMRHHGWVAKGGKNYCPLCKLEAQP